MFSICVSFCDASFLVLLAIGFVDGKVGVVVGFSVIAVLFMSITYMFMALMFQ